MKSNGQGKDERCDEQKIPDSKMSEAKKKVKVEKKCDEGKVLNPVTNRCNKIKVKLEKKCEKGKVLNPVTNRCVNVKNKKNPEKDLKTKEKNNDNIQGKTSSQWKQVEENRYKIINNKYDTDLKFDGYDTIASASFSFGQLPKIDKSETKEFRWINDVKLNLTLTKVYGPMDGITLSGESSESATYNSNNSAPSRVEIDTTKNHGIEIAWLEFPGEMIKSLKKTNPSFKYIDDFSTTKKEQQTRKSNQDFMDIILDDGNPFLKYLNTAVKIFVQSIVDFKNTDSLKLSHQNRFDQLYKKLFVENDIQLVPIEMRNIRLSSDSNIDEPEEMYEHLETGRYNRRQDYQEHATILRAHHDKLQFQFNTIMKAIKKTNKIT